MIFDESEPDKDYQKALDTIFLIVSYSPRTVKEVETKLAKKSFSEEAKTAAIAEATNLGLLNDAEFARMWVESRKHRIGTSGLRRELLTKGIPKEMVDETLQVYVEAGEEADALRSLAEKKARTYPPTLDLAKKKNRLAGHLLRKGFSPSDVYPVVNSVLQPNGEY